MPSHGHGWELSDDGKLTINWMTGSQLQRLFWGSSPEVVLGLFSLKRRCVFQAPDCECLVNALKCTVVCCLQGLLSPGFVVSRVCCLQGLLSPGFIVSRVCCLQGLLSPGFVVSRVCCLQAHTCKKAALQPWLQENSDKTTYLMFIAYHL